MMSLKQYFNNACGLNTLFHFLDIINHINCNTDFSPLLAPGGSILEEGEKSTWKTSVCVFEANDDDLKSYMQVHVPPLKYVF